MMRSEVPHHVKEGTRYLLSIFNSLCELQSPVIVQNKWQNRKNPNWLTKCIVKNPEAKPHTIITSLDVFLSSFNSCFICKSTNLVQDYIKHSLWKSK